MIDLLLNELNWDTSDEDKEKALNQLIQIDDDLIPTLIRYKDGRAAKVLKGIGYPRVKNVLYELLGWLKDINWPGAYDIADLIVSIGTPMIPHIKRAFEERDDIWHYWIITNVLEKWDKETIKPLEEELMRFVNSFDLLLMTECVDIASMKLLLERHLGDTGRITQVYSLKTDYIGQINDNIGSIKELVKQNTDH
ncbi:DUF5071 domain-containing protein [Desulfosporosinus sp. SYSU MS00001]|uniref:DUF5071 domain-containing protein n=1 Tax=Desulfosporosinus sp. SYSU MS00001 TaxID=3416284 RepID=UPI003CFA790C